jgi:uncharacterized protein YjiS (DUF1127 family)
MKTKGDTMFDRLRHRMKKQRKRRLIRHATAHLTPHMLRDIGLTDPHHGLTQLRLTSYPVW